MKIYERITLLRKYHLHLTQTEFGEKLGVSRSVIANIEYNRVEIKEHIINLICRTFNVNENWLRNGTEPIFKEQDALEIEEIAKSLGLDGISLKILQRFSKLTDEEQQKIIELAKMLPILFSDEQEIKKENKSHLLSKEEFAGRIGITSAEIMEAFKNNKDIFNNKKEAL